MKTPNDDIALFREPRRPNGRQPRMMMTDEMRTPDAPPPRNPRRARTADGAKPGADKAAARRRVILGVLLCALAFFVLLAIVSYSRADQANADLKPSDITGLLRNDDAVRAKFDVTRNWVGLLGAIVANVLINGTVGFAALAIPVLCALWGAALIRNAAGKKLAVATTYTLLGAAVFAAFVGTLQRITWMPTIPQELSGGIGQFVAAVFSGLLGTAGAIILLAALGFTLAIAAFDADVHRTIMRVKLFADAMRDTFANRLAERAARKNEKEAQARAAAGEQMELLAAEDDEEPARILHRQMNPSAQTAEAQINRPGKKIGIPAQPKSSQSKPKEEKKALTPEEQRKFVESQNADDAPEFGTATVPELSGEIGAAAPATEPGKPSVENGNTGAEDDSAAKPSLTLRVQETGAEEPSGESTAAEFAADESDALETIVYTPPAIDLLKEDDDEVARVSDEELKEHARILQEKLATFNVMIEDVQVTPGPVVTLYEFVPAAGIKISQIESLQDDIALAMKARGIRIIAPIPGKGTVGVEIPNDAPATVRIRGLIATAAFREFTGALPLALGKTTAGDAYFADLAAMPHLLIAGATGSGKSVGINSMLISILYKRHPSEVKFVIIDPKKIELSTYRSLRNHFLAVCPDVNEDILTTPQNAVIALKSVELEMERRYDLLAKAGVRHLTDYNERIASGKVRPAPEVPHRPMPYLVVVIDELADLMITAAREVEEPISRLAQLARAVGIHLLVATQRPSVDVITGVIKANFSPRIAYAVASRIDSRTILDGSGAEQLLGKGDMLYLSSSSPKPIRLQNPLITTDDIEAVTGSIASQQGYSHPYILPSVVEKKRSVAESGGSRDELFESAARLVVQHQQGSVSLLQRRLKVGYSRAARIIDELEMAGIVGPFDGSKAREVLIEDEEMLETQLGA